MRDKMKDSMYNLKTYDEKGNVKDQGNTNLDSLKNDLKLSFKDSNSPNIKTTRVSSTTRTSTSVNRVSSVNRVTSSNRASRKGNY